MATPNPSAGAFFQGEWAKLEAIVGRFEEAWQRGGRPAIEEYLAAEGGETRQLLLELAHADLECGLKAGLPIRVEAYLGRYAELAGDRAGALRLIEAEYRLRRRREPGLESAEYLRRFPQYRQDLVELFRTPAMAGAGRAGEKDGTGPSSGRASPAPGAGAGLPRLGQFELMETIGQGAFGIVYRARDVDLDRLVAIKVPRQDLALTPADVARFLREARNAAGLSHAGIVPVYEVGHAEAGPYLVSAYVEGATLAETLARRSLSPREAARVVAQVAEALDHAHAHGVVHRDLKPSNIMLGQIQGSGPETGGSAVLGQGGQGRGGEAPGNLQALVMDFGLARRDEGESRLTLEGQILGTPAYMSPEQARGQGHQVDGRSDLYSLGVILYELLTGELPFRGVTRMVLQQILTEEPRPPRRLNDRIPRSLETITLKCLAKEPGRRYATAAALAADLRRYLADEPIHARPVGSLERCWRWARRNPRLASLSAAVFLLLASVVFGSLLAAVLINRGRTAARAAEAKAHQAQEKAEEHAAIAGERLGLALDALERLVYEVQEQLQDQPTTLKLKENLLRTAAEGLKHVADHAREVRADRSLAAAEQRLGDIFLVLGQPAPARERYERSRAIAASLAAAEPRDPENRRAFCVATAKLGEVALREGNVAAARAYSDQALALGQELAGNSPGRPAAARDLARCYTLAGEVQRRLGDPRGAAAQHRKAMELARQVLAADPQSVEIKQDLAVAYLNLGDASLQAGEVHAARTAYEQARELHEALVHAEPKSARAQRSLSVTYEKLGSALLQEGATAACVSVLVVPPLSFVSALLQEGATAAARVYYRKALACREKLAAADPYNPVPRRDLAVAYGKAGEFSERLGDTAAAGEYYRKALDLLAVLAAASPGDAQARRDVAVAELKLGSVSLRLGDERAAREYHLRALTGFEALAAGDLAAAYGSAGNAAIQMRAYAEAARCFRRGVSALGRLEARGKLKEQPVYQGWLRDQQQKLSRCEAAERAVNDLAFALAQPAAQAKEFLGIRARVLAARGEHAAAAATADKLRELDPADATTLYEAACCYALCATGVAPGKAAERLSPEEAAARLRYTTRALQDLARAVEQGYQDAAQLEADPDLAALRSDRAYQRLLERLRARPRPPGPSS